MAAAAPKFSENTVPYHVEIFFDENGAPVAAQYQTRTITKVGERRMDHVSHAIDLAVAMKDGDTRKTLTDLMGEVAASALAEVKIVRDQRDAAHQLLSEIQQKADELAAVDRAAGIDRERQQAAADMMRGADAKPKAKRAARKK